MSNEQRGRLVLEEVYGEEAEKKIVIFLLKYLKGTSDEQIKKKVKNTPFILSKNMPAEKAQLFIKAFQKMADLATRKSVEGKPIQIKIPILHMTKAEIIKKGVELNVPFDKTWSCYIGGNKACGRCDSCMLRLKGFKEAGFKDPIKYEALSDWVSD